MSLNVRLVETYARLLLNFFLIHYKGNNDEQTDSFNRSKIQRIQSATFRYLFSFGLALALLLVLIPVSLYGLNKLNSDYSTHMFHGLKQLSGVNIDESTVQYLDQNFNSVRHDLDDFYFVSVPIYFWQTMNATKKALDRLKSAVTFKKMLGRIFKHIVELKHKYLNYVEHDFSFGANNDIDQIKQELDKRFNFTFKLLSQHLVKQLKRLENSKLAYELEMKQMRVIQDIRDMEAKYADIVKQIQELKQQHVSSLNKSDWEYISLVKLKELINQTLLPSYSPGVTTEMAYFALEPNNSMKWSPILVSLRIMIEVMSAS